jgi:hypothetical protein
VDLDAVKYAVLIELDELVKLLSQGQFPKQDGVQIKALDKHVNNVLSQARSQKHDILLS